jgi:FtsZ-binding cell division protein ZapB
MSNPLWIKGTMDQQQLEMEIKSLREAVISLQSEVVHSREDRTELRKLMTELTSAVAGLTTRLAVMQASVCPSPGMCVALSKTLATQADDIKTLQADRYQAKGALIILGMVGAAIVAGIGKLIFDGFAKAHP